MAVPYRRLAAPEELRPAFEELLTVCHASIAAYRAAEERVEDHRLEAVIGCLCRDHERHLAELTDAAREAGVEVTLDDGARGDSPVEAVVVEPGSTEALLGALHRAEAEMHAAYRRQIERGLSEPTRAMLARHHGEVEAHLEWLAAGPWPARHPRAEGSQRAGPDDYPDQRKRPA